MKNIGKSAALFGATLMALSFATPAAADPNMGDAAQLANLELLPPSGYEGRRWQAPNGCDYSRAGRPGETVWYLIINTAGGRDCARQLVDSVYEDDAALSVVARQRLTFE